MKWICYRHEYISSSLQNLGSLRQPSPWVTAPGQSQQRSSGELFHLIPPPSVWSPPTLVPNFELLLIFRPTLYLSPAAVSYHLWLVLHHRDRVDVFVCQISIHMLVFLITFMVALSRHLRNCFNFIVICASSPILFNRIFNDFSFFNVEFITLISSSPKASLCVLSSSQSLS